MLSVGSQKRNKEDSEVSTWGLGETLIFLTKGQEGRWPFGRGLQKLMGWVLDIWVPGVAVISEWKYPEGNWKYMKEGKNGVGGSTE